MKKILIGKSTAIIVALSGVNISFAQDGEPPNFTPLEMQACNYKDGKDSSDFDAAMVKMVKWMDDNNSQPYAAWRLNKFYTGPDRQFDFLYIGAWPNGPTMGKDITEYRETAGDEIEAFEEVVECPGSQLLASLETKAAPEGDLRREDVVITMSDCKVAEGRKTADAIAAVRAYGEYRTANGSPGGTWLWFSVYGGGAVDGDFKVVNSHSSIEALGDSFQWSVENASYVKSAELFDGLLDCDVARAYTGDNIVNTFPTD